MSPGGARTKPTAPAIGSSLVVLRTSPLPDSAGSRRSVEAAIPQCLAQGGGEAISTERQRGTRRSRRVLLLLVVAAGAAFLLLSAIPGGEDSARAEEKLTANSVCEAQELKARKAEDPGLEIVIPAEYDKPFPSLSACRSHELAWDPDAPGPRQPIPFSHRHHAGEYQIECLYCHSATERSQAAGVPSVELCMGCHAAFPAEYDSLEGIRILKQHWEEKRPVQWQQIHRLPEHVQFRHNRHVKAGVDCQTCHGPVQEMEKLYLVPDTNPGPSLLPAKKLEMGWCINCHRENGVSQDCLTCHY